MVTPSLYHMFKAYTEFQKLKKVMIGSTISSTIVKRDPKIRSKLSPTTQRLLTQLLDETEEDYQNLIKVCEDFGVKVVRPIYSQHSLDPYLMQPRDNAIVLDDKLVICQSAQLTAFDQYINPLGDKNIIKNDFTKQLNPPSIVRVGKDIIVDKQTNIESNKEYGVNYLREWLSPLGYNIIFTETHNLKFKNNWSHTDACFSIQKPGVALTINEAELYTEKLFKKWDILTVKNSWEQMEKWTTFKKDTKAYTFIDKKYHDDAWNSLITNWFSNWVGYAKETVFDVNVLSLDEEHVVVSNYNKEVFDFFKKQKIEPIISPWRHRYFWDGGIHCITLDLEREGGCEKYL